MLLYGLDVKGKLHDKHTRCEHYHEERDIIAIKFKCCNTYYPCYKCHQEEADHPIKLWSKDEFSQKAILCGACGYELTIRDYVNGHSSCPKCKASFNPGCKYHNHLYFETNKKR
ncbi:CHY zinc finger protein [Salinibacillus kushneri]|uniref:CHY zinc finger protein n=1 Tax=Salinibacillus kushneri TaxID=237682 RepID=UPI001FE0D50A|nr:CHY zinc finger protein [Salinibacillus kushneri]